MIRNFFRHIGEGLKNVKRNGWMTVASVSAVTVTLTLVGIFLAVILNVAKIAEDMKNKVEVSVFVDIGATQKEKDTLEKELKALPDVDQVRFSSSQEEYENLVSKFGETWKLFDGDKNPLYDVFVVSATSSEAIRNVQKKAEKLDNVERADYGKDTSERIFTLSKNIRLWGSIAAVFLIFVAIFLISNTIRITIISRKREIQIMRLVGARNGFIRWPFFLEGAFIGILGSIIPVLLVIFGYRQVYQILAESILGTSYELIPYEQLSLLLSTSLLATGVILGSVGSVLSIRRFLKI